MVRCRQGWVNRKRIVTEKITLLLTLHRFTFFGYNIEEPFGSHLFDGGEDHG
jgi:hypothetical protein